MTHWVRDFTSLDLAPNQQIRSSTHWVRDLNLLDPGLIPLGPWSQLSRSELQSIGFATSTHWVFRLNPLSSLPRPIRSTTSIDRVHGSLIGAGAPVQLTGRRFGWSPLLRSGSGWSCLVCLLRLLGYRRRDVLLGAFSREFCDPSIQWYGSAVVCHQEIQGGAHAHLRIRAPA